jgi:hypothetical protein
MYNELNDEAGRDNPIRSAAFGAKQNAGNNNTPRGGRSHRGRGTGRGADLLTINLINPRSLS